MKKFSIIVLAMMGFAGGYAQETETDYVPMVREGVKWVYYFINGQSRATCHITYELSGEVEMNGKTYAKCWRTFGENGGIFETEPTVVAYLREEDKKVYAIYEDTFVGQTRNYHAGYHEYQANEQGVLQIQGISWSMEKSINGYAYPEYNDEYLIYDFNDVEDFYDRYPAVTYNCGALYPDYPNTVISYMIRKKATPSGTVLVNGRNLPKYNISTYIEESARAGQRNAAVVDPSARVPMLVEGYGEFNLFLGNPDLRSAIACAYKSFISPDAVLRHVDTRYNGSGNFGFCHIEDNSTKVITSTNCEYIDRIIGDAEVAVEDLPVDTPADGSGPLYDLQGRVVANPAPGIYVRNGQKVVVE